MVKRFQVSIQSQISLLIVIEFVLATFFFICVLFLFNEIYENDFGELSIRKSVYQDNQLFKSVGQSMMSPESTNKGSLRQIETSSKRSSLMMHDKGK